MRRILLRVAALGLLIALGPSAAVGSSDTGPLVRVSGPSPFADCPPADLDGFLPEGEIEPYVAVNPTNPANVVGVWMQDRFRGLVAGVSFDAGATWRRARQIFDPGPNKLTTGNEIVVLPDGRLVDGFTLIAVGAPYQPEAQSSVAVIGSNNKGRSWSLATIVDRLRSVGTTDPETGDRVAAGNLLTDLAVDPASVFARRVQL
jgi:hypothetical protein